MNSDTALVSIGLPVFNGEEYLESSLDAIVAQTYGNFELIISDNASTDRTQEICKEYAARFPFVKYSRNDDNIGGFRNNNRVIDLSSGKYFLLTGADDLRDPQQLSRCVEFLEHNEQYVMCQVETIYIDESGDRMTVTENAVRINAAAPEERFRQAIRDDYRVEPVYGMVRREALGNIRFGQFADSDRVWVAELALRAPFHRIDEPLFFRRIHSQKSTKVYRKRHQRGGWVDPGKKASLFVFPYLRQWRAYISAVTRADLPWASRRRCYLTLAVWLGTHSRQIRKELIRPLVLLASRIKHSLK